MTGLHRAVKEALVIALVAATLGFMNSALRGKGVFAAVGSPSSPLHAPVSPTMIHLPEAKDLFESEEALFIDARHEFEYAHGHIPGALNLPISEFDARRTVVDFLPKDRILITYCDGVECNSSINLATKLHEAGFSGVRIFFGGWNEWTSQDLPTEATRP